MSDYELLHDVNVGAKPRETKETEGPALDHGSVAKAVEHGRPEALGARGAMHLQRLAGNAAMGSLVQREAEESPVKDIVGKGGGTALDDSIRKPLEAHHGADLSDVRIHTGPKANEAATSVQSLAFTSGTDIVFKDGHYNPGSKEGMETLAHETAHVVQQRSGPVDGTPREDGTKVSDPSDRFEREAVASASVFSSSAGSHAGHDHAPLAGAGAGVQREAESEEVQTMRDPSVQREAEGGEEEAEEIQQIQDTSVQREAGGAEEEAEEEVQQIQDTSVQREGEGVEEEAEEA